MKVTCIFQEFLNVIASEVFIFTKLLGKNMLMAFEVMRNLLHSD